MKPPRLMPPLYLVLHIAAMYGVYRLMPTPRLPNTARFAGMALMALGVLTIVYCAGLFKRRNTTLKPFQESSTLVTEGPFAWSRNPIYTSMVVILAGAATAFGSPLPWLVIPVFVLCIRWRFIAREEAMLEQRFPDEYRAYRGRVRRWL